MNKFEGGTLVPFNDSVHDVFKCKQTLESICDALFPWYFDNYEDTIQPTKVRQAAIHVIIFSSTCKIIRQKVMMFATDGGKYTQFATLKWFARNYCVDSNGPPHFRCTPSESSELQYVIGELNDRITDFDRFGIPYKIERKNLGYDVEKKCVCGTLHFSIQFGPEARDLIQFTIDLSKYNMFVEICGVEAWRQEYAILVHLEECTKHCSYYFERVSELKRFLTE